MCNRRAYESKSFLIHFVHSFSLWLGLGYLNFMINVRISCNLSFHQSSSRCWRLLNLNGFTQFLETTLKLFKAACPAFEVLLWKFTVWKALWVSSISRFCAWYVYSFLNLFNLVLITTCNILLLIVVHWFGPVFQYLWLQEISIIFKLCLLLLLFLLMIKFS